jgi:DNA-binding NtrC family response regulator
MATNSRSQAESMKFSKLEDRSQINPQSGFMSDFSYKIGEIDDLFFLEKEGKIHRLLLDSLEKPLFERILKYTRGNKLKAAKILGINRNTLRTKLTKLGIS